HVCFFLFFFFFFFSSRRRHTRFSRDWSSDVCSSDLHYLLCFSPPFFSFPLMFVLCVFGFWCPVSFVHFTSSNLLRLHQQRSRNRSEERRVGKECRSRWSPSQ